MRVLMFCQAAKKIRHGVVYVLRFWGLHATITRMNTDEPNTLNDFLSDDDTRRQDAPNNDDAPSNDVDLALAALSNLNDLAREEEPAPASDELFDTIATDDAPDIPSTGSHFPQPPLSQLERGQAASVVPSLVLIGVGAFLTFLLTTKTPLPSDDFVGGLALIGMGISAVSYWLSSARWSKGSLVVGVVLAIVGVGVVLL
jgi:hypothetical protein